jgi:NifU-like protein
MHDVKSVDGTEWFYTEIVKEHFFNPQNILKTKDEEEVYNKEASGIGEVGSPACGDVMKMWIKIKDNKISECKWRTFGCASAIAATSMFSTMIIGMTIEEALNVKPKDIADNLGGLPMRKFHCSVLADQSFKAAIKDYKENQ